MGLALWRLALVAHAAAEQCALTSSGPVVATEDGQILENLDIETTGTEPGVLVAGYKNVVIRNVRVRHHEQSQSPYGVGISLSHADGAVVENIDVALLAHNSTGPLQSWHNFNIQCEQSVDVRISNIRVSGGSTGVQLDTCHGAVVSKLVAENVRGPFPRGQCLQSARSDNVVLEDFYCGNSEFESWTEDSISLWRSANNTVRRGLVNGSNSPTGIGVMVEQDDTSKAEGLVEDVDAVNMGNGCFSTYGGTNIRFVRTRCRRNHCQGWGGRGKPRSNSLLFAAGDENGCVSSNIQLQAGSYFDICNPGNLIWEMTKGAWTQKDLQQEDFTLRERIHVHLCFDAPEVIV